MRTNFEDITRRKWERWSFDALKAESPDGGEVEKRMDVLVGIMYEESYGLGYALRRHNARMASSQGKKIIVQNVLEDWMSMSYNLSLERTAAVVHLQTILMVSKMLHEWLLRFETVHQVSHLCKVIKGHLDKMKQAIDLRSDIWELGVTTLREPIKGCSMMWKRGTEHFRASEITSLPRQALNQVRHLPTILTSTNGMFL